MRIFLILLLMANMAYFAWRMDWFVPEAGTLTELQQPQFRQAEQALTLVAELSDERRALMSTLAEARAARSQAAEQLQQTREQVEAVAGEIQDNAVALADDQARTAETPQQLLDMPDAAVATTGPPEAVPPPPAEAVSAVTAQAVAVQPWCANTAIIADQAAAAAFAQRLIESGASATIGQREVPVSSTWWVHLPAFASEAEARAVLAELQAKGIDSYYMRTGEMAGGISLGVYSREESGRIAQRQLAARGYTASIREVIRMEERPFVQLMLPDVRLRDSAEWPSLLATAGSPELTEFTCEAIASPNEFP